MGRKPSPAACIPPSSLTHTFNLDQIVCGGQGLRGAYFLVLYLGYRTFLMGLTGTLLCVQLSNPASAAGLVMTTHTRYAVPWQPVWPSITAETNATVRSRLQKSV